MVIAIDFDGTLFGDAFPLIGSPNTHMIDFAKKARKNGHKLIMWTCRGGNELLAAVEECRKYGLEFDAVNESLPEQRAAWENDSRKIYADMYIDDKSVPVAWIGPGRGNGRSIMARKVFMAVTADKFELPLAVESSALLLAVKMKTTERDIYNKLYKKAKNPYVNRFRVVTTEIEEDE